MCTQQQHVPPGVAHSCSLVSGACRSRLRSLCADWPVEVCRTPEWPVLGQTVWEGHGWEAGGQVAGHGGLACVWCAGAAGVTCGLKPDWVWYGVLGVAGAAVSVAGRNVHAESAVAKVQKNAT